MASIAPHSKNLTFRLHAQLTQPKIMFCTVRDPYFEQIVSYTVSVCMEYLVHVSFDCKLVIGYIPPVDNVTFVLVKFFMLV